jgi:hypothetical protein
VCRVEVSTSTEEHEVRRVRGHPTLQLHVEWRVELGSGVDQGRSSGLRGCCEDTKASLVCDKPLDRDSTLADCSRHLKNVSGAVVTGNGPTLASKSTTTMTWDVVDRAESGDDGHRSRRAPDVSIC